MTRIIWGENRSFHAGVDRGVCFPQDGPGIPWNGLVSVEEARSPSNSVDNYYDGDKYRRSTSFSNYSADVKVFTYPDEVEDSIFGFSYRTRVNEQHYQIHLVYNAEAYNIELEHSSMGLEITPTLISMKLDTTPIKLEDYKAFSHIVIDTRFAYPEAIEEFEDILYGSEINDSEFLSPQNLIDFFESKSMLVIIDHGDGTWTAIGPDEAIVMLDETLFEITWPSVKYINSETYKISSW